MIVAVDPSAIHNGIAVGDEVRYVIVVGHDNSECYQDGRWTYGTSIDQCLAIHCPRQERQVSVAGQWQSLTHRHPSPQVTSHDTQTRKPTKRSDDRLHLAAAQYNFFEHTHTQIDIFKYTCAVLV